MTDAVMQILQNAAGHFQRGDFAAALTASEQALAAAPGHPEALHMKALALGRLGRIDEAAGLFDRAAAVHPRKQAILANKGNALRAAGRNAEASAAYEAALAADPGFAAAWASLGLARREAGDRSGAEAAFRSGLAAAPDDPRLLNNLGLLLEAQERSEESVALFSKALERQPNMLSALINRGAALRRTGRTEAALADLNAAVGLAPGDAEAWFQLASAHRQAGAGAAAEAAYLKAAALAPARADIHRDLARMLWEAGRADDFLAPLDAAIAQTGDPGLLVLKGDMAYLAGKMDVAETAAREALQRKWDSSSAHRIIAQARRQLGDYAMAKAHFAKALEQDRNDFETVHAFAEMLLDMGEFDAAVSTLAGDAPPDHLQKHVALKANAMRLTGDDTYRSFYDYDRFTKKMFIETPPGFADLDAFNAALVDAILPLHGTKVQPIDQTLYGGTQSAGRLWEVQHPVIQALKESLLAAAARFVDALPDDPGHPFLARKTKDLKCAGAWSVVLADGGGHVDHIHPKGWISACYYVRVPDEVLSAEKQGFLRLGACTARHRPLPAERWLKPEAGAVIFFPSYMWHGVEPFSAPTPRITAPFDLAPA